MDPYRLFFPLGILASVLATVPWIAFALGLTTTYPGNAHPDLMMGGFLFAFAAGFLMTAVPRFTGASRCGSTELRAGAFAFVLLLCAGFADQRIWFHLLSLGSLSLLVRFCAVRFLQRTSEPPTFFIFVGLGLGMGLAGAALSVASDLGMMGAAGTVFARLIYYQGMMLSLILGVGSQLLPAIWGWAPLPTASIGSRSSAPRSRPVAPVLALAVALLSCFVIEALVHPVLGRGLRALLVSHIAVTRWKILKRPKARGSVAWWLWISAWCLLLGLWLSALMPTFSVHALHLAFIGGFGLMTLMVGSRVSLAHSGFGEALEQRIPAVTATAVLILFAAAGRALAIAAPESYVRHLGYAAALWIAGVATWSAYIVPKWLHPKGDTAEGQKS